MNGKMNGNKDVPIKSRNSSFGELISKFAVGRQGTYVLNSCASNEKFAVALSSYMAVVYDGQNNQIAEYVHNNVITGIKFSNRDPSLLFTSCLDGKINVWDSRCNESVQTFLDKSSGVPKPLTCFDYNSDETFVSAGTELIREDSFLLFWDRRSSECLGGYWDSHTDDISQVQFHSPVKSRMASASVDGLINLFDLNKNSEEEALVSTLNVGTAVNKLSWVHSNYLTCVTTLEDYQLWCVADASPVLSMNKEDLSNNLMYNVDYVIDSLKIDGMMEDELQAFYLATGSNDGTVHLSCLNDKDLKPVGSLSNGHTDVVRTICYNSQANVILTGGEDGSICQWKILPSTA